MPTTSLALARAADMRHKIRRGLVGYWPLASAGAVDLKEYHGNPQSLTLTNNNTVTRGAGPSSNLPDAAVMVAASNQYYSHLDSALFNVKAPWSLCIWFNLGTGGTNRGIIGKYVSTGNQRSIQAFWNSATNRIQLGVSDDGTTTAGHLVTADFFSAISTSTWYFLAWGQDATFRIWGSLNASTPTFSTAISGSPFDSTAPFEIGNLQNGTAPWDGSLTQAGLWSGHQLSTAEIAWLYNNGQGRDLRRLA